MAVSNWLRSALFSHRRSLPHASLATDHSPLATIPSQFVLHFLDDRLARGMLFGQSGVNPADLRTVKLSPALPIRLFRKTCVIRISGSLVSVCRRPNTPRAAFRLGAARGSAARTELTKTIRTIPTY